MNNLSGARLIFLSGIVLGIWYLVFRNRKNADANVRKFARYEEWKRKQCRLIQDLLDQNQLLSEAQQIHLRNCDLCRYVQRSDYT